MPRSVSEPSWFEGVTCPFSVKNSRMVPLRSRGLENLRLSGAQAEGFDGVRNSCLRVGLPSSRFARGLSYLHSIGLLWLRDKLKTGAESIDNGVALMCKGLCGVQALISCNGHLDKSFPEAPRRSLSANASISPVRPVCRSLFEAGIWFSSSGDLFLTFLGTTTLGTGVASGGSSTWNVLWLTVRKRNGDKQ